MTPARLALGLVGKAAITCSYAMVYLYTAEAYPTVIRGVGLAAGAMFARLGGVVAPLAAELVRDFDNICFSFGHFCYIASDRPKKSLIIV